jgi:hypothetical protein
MLDHNRSDHFCKGQKEEEKIGVSNGMKPHPTQILNKTQKGVKLKKWNMPPQDSKKLVQANELSKKK